MGQNWLSNPRLLKIIAQAGNVGKRDKVLEVGAGTGWLTNILAETGAAVLAVEKDPRLVEFLQERFKNQKNVKILEGDILKINPKKLGLRKSRFKVVGNIPYYLTSRLLRLMLEDWPAPKVIVFTIQKEVAQRIAARPPKMNLLALSVQFFARPEIVCRLSRKNFHPMPKVDSSIIKIVPGRPFLESKREKDAFFRVAKAGFSHKRQQLINSLSTRLELSKNTLNTILKAAGINSTRRPESLSVEEWAKLSSSLLPAF